MNASWPQMLYNRDVFMGGSCEWLCSLQYDSNTYPQAVSEALRSPAIPGRRALAKANGSKNKKVLPTIKTLKNGQLFGWQENAMGTSNQESRKIDVVLFDFGGVIAEEGWKEGLKVVAKANGLDESKFLEDAIDTIYATGYLLGKATEDRFWSSLREKTGIKENDALLREEIFSRFLLREWMIDLVKTLRAQKITVGILSDQTDMLDKLNQRYHFFKWFDHVFNSYHLGKGKRDSSLFDDVARTLRCSPDRILFIDDDPGHVDRAREKGWNAIWYVDRGSFFKELRMILN
jgi:putative hydrolase of the HAD superfamily